MNWVEAMHGLRGLVCRSHWLCCEKIREESDESDSSSVRVILVLYWRES